MLVTRLLHLLIPLAGDLFSFPSLFIAGRVYLLAKGTKQNWVPIGTAAAVAFAVEKAK